MVSPSLIMSETGERIALRDGESVEASEDTSTPTVFVDAVMKSLSSSLVASGVMGAIGSSESRGKSRPRPRAIADRPDRSSPNTPPSRGTRQSGVSLVPTPPLEKCTSVSGSCYSCDETFLGDFDQVRCARWINLGSS